MSCGNCHQWKIVVITQMTYSGLQQQPKLVNVVVAAVTNLIGPFTGAQTIIAICISLIELRMIGHTSQSYVVTPDNSRQLC